MRGIALAGGGLLGLGLCALALLFQPSPTTALAQGPAVCNTYDSPGTHLFEVPDGVTEVTAEVFGAQGGDVGGTNPQFGEGGLGGGATGVQIPVTPGELLEITVGGRGFDSLGASSPAPVGGFNGGGDGARGSAHTSTSGGGASQINRGSDVLIIVGGGGGGAHGGDGGDGGLTGEDGTKHAGSLVGSTPGQAGGDGGAGGEGGDAGPGTADDQDGGDGSAGQGGTGGGHATNLPVDGGGGGGGGFVGGGGGGGGGGNGGSGGGGGSSFDSTGTATFQTGVEEDDGRVTLTYDCDAAPEPLAACVTFDEAGAETFVVPAGVTEIQAAVYGAQGGNGNNGGVGGLGGGATALPIPVTPGETLDIVVGEEGADAPAGPSAGGAGGSPGGGNGGFATSAPGAGGGGLSEILRGTDSLVIGGAGGGAGRSVDGGAGGPVGTNGENVTGLVFGSGGFSGGNGGVGGGIGASAGANGTADQGGNGGTPAANQLAGGGGGGAGAIGGGGGQGVSSTGGGAGGGGGSSAHSLGNVPVTWGTGVEEGDGRVEIAYDCADVGIAKDAALVGPDTIEYTVEVENFGPNDATGVTVTDPLPEGVTYVSDDCGGTADAGGWTWSIGDLAQGASLTCVITVTATEFGTIENTASVDSDQVDENPTNDDDDAEVFIPSADLETTKVAQGGPFAAGDNVTYLITVTNNGPNAAADVELTDDLPASLTLVSATPDQGSCNAVDPIDCDLGTIAANGDATVTVVATIGADQQGNQIGNTACAETTTADADAENDCATEQIDVEPEADLEVIKTADPEVADPGDTVTWSVRVVNHGPNASGEITLTDTLPANVTYVSDDGGCDTSALPVITCTVASLADEASATIEIDVTVDEEAVSSVLTNTASAEGETPDPNPDNNEDDATVEVPPLSDLAILKSVSDETPFAGEQVVYTLDVTNNGPSTSDPTEVVDTLPAGVTYVSDDSSCDTSALPEITCDVGSLADGGTAQVNITVTVDNDSVGELENTATVSGPNEDQNPDNNEDDETIDVQPIADLHVTKTVEPGGTVRVGDLLTYTVEVENLGPSEAADVTLDDDFTQAGVEIVSVTPSQGTCSNADPIDCQLGSLASGVTAELIVVARPLTRGPLDNQAVAGSSTEDPVETNNDDDLRVGVQPARVEIRKVADDRRIGSGDRVSYEIRVRSRSDVPLEDVRVCDKVPRSLKLIAAPGADVNGQRACWTVDLDPNETRTFTVRVKAKPTDHDLRVTNTAKVSGPDVDGAKDRERVRVKGAGGEVSPEPCPSRRATARC